jgi:hypothetical protein
MSMGPASEDAGCASLVRYFNQAKDKASMVPAARFFAAAYEPEALATGTQPPMRIWPNGQIHSKPRANPPLCQILM